MQENHPIVVERRSSREARAYALRQIYDRVLERQPYESERASFKKEEKDFLKGKIGIRRFLKIFCKSDLYLDNFYYATSNPKFIETCFKHLLGRSIRNGGEMRYYINILTKSGVGELITAILDSDEYRKNFGCFTVPYHRENQCHKTPNEYLETSIVEKEHFGQRGWALPALYWHQLGLNCDGGVCLYIGDEPSEVTFHAVQSGVPQEGDELQEELMELLMAL